MIRTPYPELTHDTDARAADLDAWNAEVKRARIEYRRHPFAACSVTDCPRLAARGRRMCGSHSGPNVRGVGVA